MKVLVVSSKYPPEYAGSGLRAHETYKRLREKFDIESEVICNSWEFAGNESYTLDDTPVTRIDYSAVSPAVLERFRWPIRRLGPAIKQNLEALHTAYLLASKEFDVIHTFGNSASTATALWWARRRGVPLMTEICNNESSPYQNLPVFGKFHGTPLGFVSEYDLQRQTVVVAISSHLREMCRDFGLTENVWTRPNPVDQNRFNPAVGGSGDPGSLTPFSADDKIVLYVAMFKQRKNHAFLVDVVDALTEEYKLVLAGPIDEDGPKEETHRRCVQEVRDRIAANGVESRVHLDPSFVDMAEYLSIADVFCFPSENEAMGTPLLESLCSGVPVVANADEPSFQEWVRDGENGHLRPLAPQEWADAIESAASIGGETRNQFAQSMLDTVSSTVVDRQYVRLLRELADASERARLRVADVVEDTGRK